MKKGRKKAVKLFDNENDAIEFKAVGGYIDYRPSKNTRCLYYCDVAKFCEHKNKKKMQRTYCGRGDQS